VESGDFLGAALGGCEVALPPIAAAFPEGAHRHDFQSAAVHRYTKAGRRPQNIYDHGYVFPYFKSRYQGGGEADAQDGGGSHTLSFWAQAAGKRSLFDEGGTGDAQGLELTAGLHIDLFALAQIGR